MYGLELGKASTTATTVNRIHPPPSLAAAAAARPPQTLRRQPAAQTPSWDPPQLLLSDCRTLRHGCLAWQPGSVGCSSAPRRRSSATRPPPVPQQGGDQPSHEVHANHHMGRTVQGKQTTQRERATPCCQPHLTHYATYRNMHTPVSLNVNRTHVCIFTQSYPHPSPAHVRSPGCGSTAGRAARGHRSSCCAAAAPRPPDYCPHEASRHCGGWSTRR